MRDQDVILIRTSSDAVASIDQVPADYHPTAVIIHRDPGEDNRNLDEIFYDPVSSNDGSRLFCMFDQMFWKGTESKYSDTYTTARYCFGLNGLVSPLVTRQFESRPGLGSVEYFKKYAGFTFEFKKFSNTNFSDYRIGSGDFYKYIIVYMFGLKVFTKIILFEPIFDHLSVKFSPFQLPPIYNEHFLKVFNIDLDRKDDDWCKICFWGANGNGWAHRVPSRYSYPSALHRLQQ